MESYSRSQNMELSADDVKIISGAVLKVMQEKAEPTLTAGVWKYTVTLTCEVDTIPYNETSLKFHEAMGFREVGEQIIRGGAIKVSLKACELE